jgi:peptidoglycan hydrolase-like protein with peptidoglycan-binding domain
MALPYQKAGLTLSRAGAGKAPIVKALQRDLRALGYLGHGIDGNFGAGTEQDLRSLQYDLLHNVGASTGGDGAAPVAVRSYNVDPATGNAAVRAVTGTLDQPTAGCIARMLADATFPKLPSAADPAAENARAMAAVAAISSANAPTPYIEAIVIQESSSRHFEVPAATDEDNFVSIGLDRNGPPDAITSRATGSARRTSWPISSSIQCATCSAPMRSCGRNSTAGCSVRRAAPTTASLSIRCYRCGYAAMRCRTAATCATATPARCRRAS